MLAAIGLRFVNKLQHNLFTFLDEDSSSSDEDEIIINVYKTRERHIKINNYLGVVMRYSDDDFQAHFRLTRTLVEDFLKEMDGLVEVKTMGRPAVKPLQCFLLTLWLLANQESFRTVADRFQFSPGHAHTIFLKTVMFITSRRDRFIKWPQNIEKTVEQFDEMRRRSFPQVVGCVDGSHIQILGKRGDDSFYNRKGVHSVILQGICNAQMEFLDIYTGWPGSAHDARVWRNSPIYAKLKNHALPSSYHLLGDTAYPLDIFLMVPFKDNGVLSQQQKNYNQVLSSTRVVIEQAFGRLKGMWRRLKYLNVVEKRYCKYVIATACVLHNVCIRGHINYDNLEDDQPESDAQELQQLQADLRFLEGGNAAKEKRNNLVAQL